ncbi:hypothetical protein CAPTEDRAFT_148319 [Capitella teleta]|uniref:L-serine ammonia-lyase n=1 Tax=Capitella teleta TaxID=283909 RepID=R7TD65_CAPTE|nr:hypothetical protein CAPTEDRAFT_148319 [Capitella teleta]|eukprot:ELT91669.1 hypothetical protein CAPTEDRAFT_148319 [Capitella teleta]
MSGPDLTSDLPCCKHVEEQLYVKTPLIESLPLSKRVGCSVHMKLENTQPSSSFKVRGISHMIQVKMSKGCERLVSSSGGNAGMAAAYCARKLKIPIDVYVPSSTPDYLKEKLVDEGASVHTHGAVWDHADMAARQKAEQPGIAYIPPFDDPLLWDGHETIIHELVDDLHGVTPDLIVLSVGGGGLLCGVAQGMRRVGWEHVPILAMETVGADCLNAAVKADRVVTLPNITSLAKCLGSLTVAKQAFKFSKERRIISRIITDKQCIATTCQFLEDHRMMVEPACGAALGAVYCDVIRDLQNSGDLRPDLKNIVMIVCGGLCVNSPQLLQWKADVGLA